MKVRIDILPEPGKPLQEGVDYLELDYIPVVGDTIILKKAPPNKEAVYGVMFRNVVVEADGRYVWGLGCKKAGGTIIPAASVSPLMVPR